MRRLIALLGLYACAGAVHGEDTASQFHQPGTYLGGELGGLEYDGACEPNALSCDRRDVAWGIFAGYRFNAYLGLEFSYLDLGEAHATYPRLTSTVEATGKVDGFDLSALFGLPLGRDWQVFARVGGFHWKARTNSPEFSVSDQGWSAEAGAGAAWQFLPSWQVRAQYVFLDDLGSDATGRTNGHFASLGLSYFFGPR